MPAEDILTVTVPGTGRDILDRSASNQEVVHSAGVPNAGITVPEQVTVIAADRAPRRRGRPGYDLEAVLRVAVEVFNERGYDGASMEDLSRRLGIAKSGIYHHVSGKEELLRLALDRALDGLAEAADRARALDAPAIGRLEMLVRDAVSVLQARLPYVTLLLRVRGNTEVERAALARRRAFDAFVASLVQEAERDGDIRADIDPKLTARLLFGTVNSIVEWYRPAPAPADSALASSALADAVCAIVFDGLRVRG
jgi:AcrR family transcriptional regulator